MSIQFLARCAINDAAWNHCIASSPNRIIYGYTWYLDAVTPAPNRRWDGLVVLDMAGKYKAVMPVPLRRKQVAGVFHTWRIYQPLFCQILSIFSASPIDPAPFYAALQAQYRYNSVLQLGQPPEIGLSGSRIRRLVTHLLPLAAPYITLYQHYTPDRRRNVRRAKRIGWLLTDSTDSQPLIHLFREYHADRIEGGVSDEGYATISYLLDCCSQRGLLTLRYALLNGVVEAGTAFIQADNRIIYLFNAASPIGRRGNARTLLIDQLIQEKAGQQLWLDFETPEKPAIAAFYQSFGAVEQPFWSIQWNRLRWWERVVRAGLSLGQYRIRRT